MLGGRLPLSPEITAERERILSELDGLVNIRPGGVVTYPDGLKVGREECDRALFETFRRIVNG